MNQRTNNPSDNKQQGSNTQRNPDGGQQQQGGKTPGQPGGGDVRPDPNDVGRSQSDRQSGIDEDDDKTISPDGNKKPGK
jgi:hypothetical protein